MALHIPTELLRARREEGGGCREEDLQDEIQRMVLLLEKTSAVREARTAPSKAWSELVPFEKPIAVALGNQVVFALLSQKSLRQHCERAQEWERDESILKGGRDLLSAWRHGYKRRQEDLFPHSH